MCHIQHACSPQTHRSTIFSLVSLLTTNSLYRSTVYILTHNVLPASPGRAHKSKTEQTFRCLLHDFSSSSPLSYSHLYSFTLIHTRYLLSCLANQIPDQSIQPITRDPVTSKFNHFLDQSSTLTTPTPTPTCSACVCQMLRRRTHLRGAPSSHRRGVNLFKLVPPARGYGLPCCYEPLRSSPVVEPAGMTSSIPCRELEFGPSRHCGASYTMTTWPLRDRKTAQVAE